MLLLTQVHMTHQRVYERSHTQKTPLEEFPLKIKFVKNVKEQKELLPHHLQAGLVETLPRLAMVRRQGERQHPGESGLTLDQASRGYQTGPVSISSAA